MILTKEVTSGWCTRELIEMVKSITKYCVQIKDHKSIHIELEKSIKSMLSGRKGRHGLIFL